MKVNKLVYYLEEITGYSWAVYPQHGTLQASVIHGQVRFLFEAVQVVGLTGLEFHCYMNDNAHAEFASVYHTGEYSKAKVKLMWESLLEEVTNKQLSVVESLRGRRTPTTIPACDVNIPIKRVGDVIQFRSSWGWTPAYTDEHTKREADYLLKVYIPRRETPVITTTLNEREP